MQNNKVTELIKYGKNTAWMLSEKGIKILLAIILARYLGKDNYGLLMYAYSFVLIFSPLSSLGLDSVTEKYLVKNPEKEKTLLGTVFLLKSGASLFSFALIIFTMFIFNFNEHEKILTALLGISFIFQQVSVFDLFFRANVLAKFMSFAKLVALFVKGLLIVFLLFTNKSLIWFALAYVIETVVSFSVSLFVYSKNKKEVTGNFFDKRLSYSLLKESFPLLFSGVAIAIYSRIDQVMLKNYLDAGAVGTYSVAVQLAESWYFIPATIGASVFPAIVKAKEKSEDFYYKTIHYFSGLTISFAFCVVLLFVFFGKYLILLLYGETFTEGATVLAIYSCAGIFAAFGVFWGKWIVIEKLQKYQFYMQGGVGVLNIFLNILLIPKYGIEGAAWATLASYAGGFFLVGMFTEKLRKMTGLMLVAIFSFGLYPFFRYKVKN